jgi:RNA polymerase sigma-70 factor, ECF subfamily
MRMPIDRPLNLPDLLAQARCGSTDALGQVLIECRPFLLQIARRQLAPDLRAKSGASDLVQDTFLEAQQTFNHFRGTTANELRWWLRCLLRHRAAKVGRQFRSTAKRRLVCEVPANGSLAADVSTPSYQASSEEQVALLRVAISRLRDDHRRVMNLRYDQGLTFEEIGRQMGRSPDAVRMLWARALEAVKHELRPLQAAD